MRTFFFMLLQILMEGGNSESLEELYDEINKLEIELQKTVLEFEITKKQLSEEQEKNKKVFC